MKIVVVGSVAFDSVETPFGKAEDVLGGSAMYFSAAASFFTDVGLVAVVGEDFLDEHTSRLNQRGIDLRGLKKVPGKTFRWRGRYDYDLNQAHTISTHLNVFNDFDPVIPDAYKKAPIVFLGNIDPELQLNVLNQVTSPKLVACDTMNYWIEGKPEALRELLKRVDLFVINEAEAREFAGEASLVKAAKVILDSGPKILIVKQGEYGALMFNGNSIFSAPAYPLEDIYDPTGAGDSFAGGLIGYLANTGELSEENIRKGIIFGSVLASFNVEAFSLERLYRISLDDIRGRYMEFKRLTHFDDL
jgi:sugar/nucleoside kinase (ribokinase family)